MLSVVNNAPLMVQASASPRRRALRTTTPQRTFLWPLVLRRPLTLQQLNPRPLLRER